MAASNALKDKGSGAVSAGRAIGGSGAKVTGGRAFSGAFVGDKPLFTKGMTGFSAPLTGSKARSGNSRKTSTGATRAKAKTAGLSTASRGGLALKNANANSLGNRARAVGSAMVKADKAARPIAYAAAKRLGAAAKRADKFARPIATKAARKGASALAKKLGL
jgi:hypothetical protein